MRAQKSIYEMNDLELKSYKRIIRLRKERRRKFLVSSLSILATLLIIVVFAFSHNSIKSNANNGFKYYTSIVVEPGETLWNLTDDYIDYNHYKNKNSYIAEVRSINHLDMNCSITAGQILVLPYYSNEYVE